MGEVKFSDNYSDLSAREGFQFEFYCECCNDAWRTDFKRYAAGTATGLLEAANSIFGGIFGGAERAADYIGDAGYRKARDKAFADAVEEAKVHFHRCRKCGNYVCAQCYNPRVNLCTGCAPSVEEEANVAARETEIELAREKAQTAVKKGTLTTDGHVVCAACGARVSKSKFCSECGDPLATKPACAGCGIELNPGAKFCPECGARQ